MAVADHRGMPEKQDWSLGDRVIDVWKADLGEPFVGDEFLKSSLSDDECQRAERFAFDRDRQVYLRSRGILRHLLSRYLGDTSPGGVGFVYNDHGKPSLHASLAGLNFNLSHSHDMAVFAFARHCDVGIDLEWIKADHDYFDLAERFYSIDEVEEIAAYPSEQRRLAFYRCWTRKEAYLKALGQGLSMELNSFAVSANPSVNTVNPLDGTGRQFEWQVPLLSVSEGYAAALAHPKGDWDIHSFEWSSDCLVRG